VPPAGCNESVRDLARIQVVPDDLVAIVDGLRRYEGGTEARRQIEWPKIVARLQEVVLNTRGVGERAENLLPIVDRNEESLLRR
jgi:hypothetical protein